MDMTLPPDPSQQRIGQAQMDLANKRFRDDISNVAVAITLGLLGEVIADILLPGGGAPIKVAGLIYLVLANVYLILRIRAVVLAAPPGSRFFWLKGRIDWYKRRD